jgi:hypothetical protein
MRCLLATKIIFCQRHLLVTGEEYVERHYVKKRMYGSKKETIKLALEEAIPLLRQAGYAITGPG